MNPRAITATLFVLASVSASGQTASVAASGEPAGRVPVQIVVTEEPLRGSQAPALSASDVAVWQDHLRLPIAELVPLKGANADLELFVLLDERINPDQTALFDQLRRFISLQDRATAVGVAYLFNGDVTIAEAPTKDHVRAAEALRATTGNESAAANPFTSLSLLIGRWTAKAPRREVLFVTDGMDRFEDVGDYNMYVEDAVSDAQRAGVLVYSLYAPALGHASHSPALIRWGQTYLGQVAEETGGEAYFPIAGTPAPYESYFTDIAKHLANQFRITFLATPDLASGFQHVRFEVGGKDAELIGAHRFYLKAPESLGENAPPAGERP